MKKNEFIIADIKAVLEDSQSSMRIKVSDGSVSDRKVLLDLIMHYLSKSFLFDDILEKDHLLVRAKECANVPGKSPLTSVDVKQLLEFFERHIKTPEELKEQAQVLMETPGDGLKTWQNIIGPDNSNKMLEDLATRIELFFNEREIRLQPPHWQQLRELFDQPLSQKTIPEPATLFNKLLKFLYENNIASSGADKISLYRTVKTALNANKSRD